MQNEKWARIVVLFHQIAVFLHLTQAELLNEGVPESFVGNEGRKSEMIA